MPSHRDTPQTHWCTRPSLGPHHGLARWGPSGGLVYQTKNIPMSLNAYHVNIHQSGWQSWSIRTILLSELVLSISCIGVGRSHEHVLRPIAHLMDPHYARLIQQLDQAGASGPYPIIIFHSACVLVLPGPWSSIPMEASRRNRSTTNSPALRNSAFVEFSKQPSFPGVARIAMIDPAG